MKKIKRVLGILKCNLWSLVGFELLFKLLSLIIFTPLFFNLFDFIMKITNYKYLTIENIGSFFLNPTTIVMLLILILLMMLYTMFDITTIITILDMSYQNKKVRITDAVKFSLHKCLNIFHLKNISLAFLVLFLIPFLHIGVSSSFITTIKVPEFISDFIVKSKTLFPLIFLLVIFLTRLLLRWLYALHYFVLENLSFKEARRKSILLSKKNHLKDFLTLTLLQFVVAIIYIIFIIIGILIIIYLNSVLGNVLLKSISTTLIWFFIALSFVIMTSLATPISYACISVLYYFHKLKKAEEIKPIVLKKSKDNKVINKSLRKFVTVLSVVVIILGTIFTYGIYKGKYNLNIEYARTLEVTAHRGSSIKYPENTFASFIGAKEEGADWIELDVQETKDGKIIVIHDTNLKRTTGLNKNTWEVTYDEIADLDAGSFLNEKFKDEHIPLFIDVVKWAKDNHIKLNVELKPTGHEDDFEKKVIDIINEQKFTDDCVITSQVYSVLENVKKYDAQIETVYVMSFAYGDIVSLEYADHFSIEATSVTSSLVEKVHKEGKQLYAWTVNTEENIKKMIDLKVDNIITDNIILAKDTIYASKTSNVINEYIKLVESLF